MLASCPTQVSLLTIYHKEKDTAYTLLALIPVADNITSLLADGVHSRLDMLGRNKRQDRGVNNRQLLHSIEQKFIRNATTHILVKDQSQLSFKSVLQVQCLPLASSHKIRWDETVLAKCCQAQPSW
jgi:hypothetical protein